MLNKCQLTGLHRPFFPYPHIQLLSPVASILRIRKCEATKKAYWLLPNTEQAVSSPANLSQKGSSASRYPFPLSYTWLYMRLKFSMYSRVLGHHSPCAQHFAAFNELSYLLLFFVEWMNINRIPAHWLRYAQKHPIVRHLFICLFSLLIRSAVCRKRLAPKSSGWTESVYPRRILGILCQLPQMSLRRKSRFLNKRKHSVLQMKLQNISPHHILFLSSWSEKPIARIQRWILWW